MGASLNAFKKGLKDEPGESGELPRKTDDEGKAPDGGAVLARERERPRPPGPEASLPPREAVTGLCLCGGESRRMGRDKALARARRAAR